VVSKLERCLVASLGLRHAIAGSGPAGDTGAAWIVQPVLVGTNVKEQVDEGRVAKMSGTTDNTGYTPSVVDNKAAQRIELTVDGHTSFIAYQLAGRRIFLNHTEVPDALQGKGVGSKLVRGALDLARQREQEVIPICPFVASYLKRHPDELDLVSDDVRQKMDLG
jgi:predicted GNAT family acetyltransferase